MRRSILILIAVVLSSVAIVSVSSLIAKRVWAQHVVRTGDDMAWFRCEFRLSDAEMRRVSELHAGYLPKCREMCARIAAKRTELQTALDAGKGLTNEVEQTIAEIGTLRAQCQIQMLRHFYEVSQAMPPEQGGRYLAEMRRLTIGSHEQFEQTMSTGPASPHGHQ